MSGTGTGTGTVRQRMRRRARAWVARLSLRIADVGEALLGLLFFWR